MLVVFGVACLGVLVEAFVPRERRYLVQVVLGARPASSPRSSAPSASACDLTEQSPATAWPAASLAAEGTLAVDGPTVFLWGLILVFAHRRRAALRRAPARGRGVGVRRPGRARCPAPRPSARRRPGASTTPRSTRC